MVAADKLPELAQGLKKSAVIETLRSQGFGNKEPLTTEDKFFRTVLDWLEKWIQVHASSVTSQDAPAIFILDTEPGLGPSVAGAGSAPAFAQSFPRTIGGNVHCCNFNLRSVWRSKADCSDGSEAFVYLQKKGLDDRAVVVFLPEQKSALIHRPGEAAEECERLRLTGDKGKSFRFEDIDPHLRTFHEENTWTIQGFCHIWDNHKIRKLKRFAEKQIQGSLCLYLKYTIGLRGSKIDQEFHTYIGRGDVAITRFSGEESFEICILELKVLRKQKSMDFNTKWALSGIRQAVKYRAAYTGVVDAYLCCFDARENDEDLPEVEQKAAENKIKSRRYFMRTPGCEGHLGESA